MSPICLGFCLFLLQGCEAVACSGEALWSHAHVRVVIIVIAIVVEDLSPRPGTPLTLDSRPPPPDMTLAFGPLQDPSIKSIKTRKSEADVFSSIIKTSQFKRRTFVSVVSHVLPYLHWECM